MGALNPTVPGRARLRPPSVQAGLTALATTTPGRACLRPPSVQAGLTALATTTPGRACLRPPSVQAGLTALVTMTTAALVHVIVSGLATGSIYALMAIRCHPDRVHAVHAGRDRERFAEASARRRGGPSTNGAADANP